MYSYKDSVPLTLNQITFNNRHNCSTIIFQTCWYFTFTGAFCGGRVRCPWHGACFNVKTGDIEDFPGLDSIPVFEV